MTEHNLDVCAHLVRIAHAFCGRDDTRYCLQGVRIEPSPEGGVVIVATDGHALIALHDEDGRTPRPVTLRLRKPVLRSWGAEHGSPARLRMNLAAARTDAPAEIMVGYGNTLDEVRAIAPAPEIDSMYFYPDWRKVVPGTPGEPIAEAGAALLGGGLLARFGKAAVRLCLREDPIKLSSALTLHSTGPRSPTFVRFAEGLPAFGLLSPVTEEPVVATVPIWARAIDGTPVNATEPASANGPAAEAAS